MDRRELILLSTGAMTSDAVRPMGFERPIIDSIAFRAGIALWAKLHQVSEIIPCKSPAVDDRHEWLRLPDPRDRSRRREDGGDRFPLSLRIHAAKRSRDAHRG